MSYIAELASAETRLDSEIRRMLELANREDRVTEIDQLFPTVHQLTPYTDDPIQDGLPPVLDPEIVS